jgi:hypothetical protein
MSRTIQKEESPTKKFTGLKGFSSIN